MFDKSCSQTVSVPPSNKLDCKYCGSEMLQLGENVYVCASCGGKCLIYTRNRSVYPDGSGWGYTLSDPYKVVWSKVEIIDNEGQSQDNGGVG